MGRILYGRNPVWEKFNVEEPYVEGISCERNMTNIMRQQSDITSFHGSYSKSFVVPAVSTKNKGSGHPVDQFGESSKALLVQSWVCSLVNSKICSLIL